jgi:hypothetical protein
MKKPSQKSEAIRPSLPKYAPTFLALKALARVRLVGVGQEEGGFDRCGLVRRRSTDPHAVFATSSVSSPCTSRLCASNEEALMTP